MDVFGHEAELGRHVAIVGGAMTAVDTAFYLLDHGHTVTMLTGTVRPATTTTPTVRGL